jgi:hypothetical protein
MTETCCEALKLHMLVRDIRARSGKFISGEITDRHSVIMAARLLAGGYL